MRGIPTIVLLFCVSNALAGCGLQFWAADLIDPASVSSIEVVWSVDRGFCESLVSRSRRSAFLISGNTDLPGFKPSPAGHYKVGSSLSPKDPMRDGYRPGISVLQFVVKRGVTYIYAGKASIPFSETSQLPIPAAEREHADQATTSAWRESLYRLHFDGSVSKECTFVWRLWNNWAL